MMFGLNSNHFGLPPIYKRLIHFHPQPPRRSFMRLKDHFKATGTSNNAGGKGDANRFLVPGATMATLAMLGVLHGRRLYEDKKELPVWLRPYVYRSWAWAFHSNMNEVALPLEEYGSLREFFARSLKEGSRPLDQDPKCLVSPVDGIVLRCGQLRGPGAMIEQVKGFSYSAFSLLGSESVLPTSDTQEILPEEYEDNQVKKNMNQRSWWRISFGAPNVRKELPKRPIKGLFYCVLYLGPGDYHRVHSPVDWHVMRRCHFSGRLYPVNERAARTIRNLHVENERVVLEGKWSEGFFAVAAIGATNVGSIELLIEPELKTNRPKLSLFKTEPPNERMYGDKDAGLVLKKGEEIAVFNMGSTVVLVFQAPSTNTFQSHQGVDSEKEGSSPALNFLFKNGDRVRMGEPIARW
ncbi:phosphatidylserine decarboxylase proenzyme 1, mitochondrial isoform X2 [Cryptomeria japonica]|uniref:phosphatidylserine decarboxylase proenzyme 1, mitochondrial isoform X2 n=1 Tax=Cryptomeria japonica TaxID=3369 RepID=UPI0027DAABD2|nr:phosphatidylserine decarboxylase proenzyme 1, mitochondrial isoform X2 [Cryptomeria japonica]